MDVRNRDVVLPANDYRRFKLVVERELDDRESPLRELIRGRGEGKKDEQVEITQMLRRPFRIDGVDLWRTVETDRESKAETFSYTTAGLRVEPDAKKKLSRVEIQSRREPLTRLSLEHREPELQPAGHGLGSGRRGGAHRLGRGRPRHAVAHPVPRISPRRVEGRFPGTAPGALPARD